ncbi:unnamed protein product [Urochloa humidicola]
MLPALAAQHVHRSSSLLRSALVVVVRSFVQLEEGFDLRLPADGGAVQCSDAGSHCRQDGDHLTAARGSISWWNSLYC